MRTPQRSAWSIPSLLALSFCLIPLVSAAQVDCSRFPFDAPQHAPFTSILDVRHVHLEAELLPDVPEVIGRVQYDFSISHPTDSIHLLTPFVRVDSAFAGATGVPQYPVPYTQHGLGSVTIHLDSLTAAGIQIDSTLRLAISFHGESAGFEDGAAWTLNAVDPWFPWTGRLEDRFTSDLELTIPNDWTATAAGLPSARRTTEDDRQILRFASAHELPARRIGFAAGIFDQTMEFSELSGGRQIGIYRFASSGAPSSSPDVLGFFSRSTGFPYPFAQYAEVSLPGVLPQGTAGIGLVPDHSAAYDSSVTGYSRISDFGLSDGSLILGPAAEAAIPLARQWFGVITSAASWPHIWLEEGLSTYMSLMYVDQAAATMPGAAAPSLMDRYLSRFRDLYLAEAASYTRPLVWDRWNHPGELLDAHAQAKSTWVLHMLRRRVGDGAFREAVGNFLDENQFRAVTTDDFVGAVAGTADEDVSQFADEWIRGAGHPVLRVDYETEGDRLLVGVQQTQQGERVPEAFHLMLELEVGTLGSTERFDVAVDERTDAFYLPVSSPPRFIAIDPDGEWLLETVVDQSTSAWVAQLRDASTPHARVAAAVALLGAEDDSALLLGLKAALDSEQNENVRTAIVRVIGSMLPDPAAERALDPLYRDPSPAVRNVVVAAYAEHPSDAFIDRALQAAQADPDPRVQAQAVRALARLHAPQAVDVARSAIITPSPGGIIREAGLDALALLHNQAPGAAFEAAVLYSTNEHSLRVRLAAIRLLGALAEGNRNARNSLAGLLGAHHHDVRTAAAAELARLGADDVLREHLAIAPSSRFRSFIEQLLACE